MKTQPHRVGLVLGTLVGGAHLVWSVLVFLGLAQALWDFILWAHMVHLPVVIGPFDLVAAVTLIIVTAIIGYLIGYIAALIWNPLHR